MAYEYPRSISLDFVDFLSGTDRLSIMNDMPTIAEGISDFGTLSKLLLMYVYHPLDGSLSLKYYSARNLSMIQQFINENVDLNEDFGFNDDYGLTDVEREIIDIFRDGLIPEANNKEVVDALSKIGINSDTVIAVVQPDGDMKSLRVVNNTLGADEWMTESLSEAFIANNIDPVNFKWASFLKVLQHYSNPIPDMQMNELDTALYKMRVVNQRDYMKKLLKLLKDDEITELDLQIALTGDLIGDGLHETITAIKQTISDDPIGDGLNTRIRLYQDEAKVLVAHLYLIIQNQGE
jgi:hypothetical protein